MRADYGRAIQAFADGLEAGTRAPRAPGGASALDYAATLHLAKGDLAAARAVVRNAPKDREAARISYLAGNWVVPWLFDDAQRELVLHAPLSLFGNDPGTPELCIDPGL